MTDLEAAWGPVLSFTHPRTDWEDELDVDRVLLQAVSSIGPVKAIRTDVARKRSEVQIRAHGAYADFSVLLDWGKEQVSVVEGGNRLMGQMKYPFHKYTNEQDLSQVLKYLVPTYAPYA